jgi:hypothetical protein
LTITNSHPEFIQSALSLKSFIRQHYSHQHLIIQNSKSTLAEGGWVVVVDEDVLAIMLRLPELGSHLQDLFSIEASEN